MTLFNRASLKKLINLVADNHAFNKKQKTKPDPAPIVQE